MTDVKPVQEVTIVPVYAKKTHSGNGGTDPLILKQDIDGGQ